MTMFRGTITAIITPFKKGGSIDEDALRRLVSFQEDNGVDAIVPCGSTGESATLSFDEHVRVVEIAVDQAKRIKVIAGAGSNSTSEAIHLSKSAEKAGADGILSISPYYNKPTQEGIFRHYEAISSSIKIPLIVYNIPGRTASNITSDTTLRLAELPGLAGIKEASGDLDQVQRIINGRPKGFAVLSGDDPLTYQMMRMGGDGTISVASNCVPDRVSRMVSMCASGAVDGAAKIHAELVPLFGALFCETNPIPIKYVMSRMGFGSGALRLPLTELTEKNRTSVDGVLKNIGL
ncbi:MAG: 4-hydroxy-tetrahydrodipicolinate synthase [Methanomassiliicoccaceae archaeon]|jgi:4-hydroxy-tetrahydrodipicolinate synthase|nr:4-hydroxy-tetrahydrodipicolinate synthase [Methanomassiliicoccaceae archaeon]